MSRTSDPLVSVIVIFFNAERFLAEAVESVLAQTYSHWELVLVDDGSTDAGSDLALGFQARYPMKVRYLDHSSHANLGMSASRNAGLEATRGEFVTFLDADDVLLPRKLADQIALLRMHPSAGMVYGRALIWHGWTGRPEDAARDHFFALGVKPNTLVQPPALFHLLLANEAQTPMTGNAMLRRSVVQMVGGFEDSFRGLYEDQILFLKVNLSWPVFVSDACWLKYRQHPDSSVADVGGGSYYARRRPMLEWLAKYLAAQGISPDSPEARAVERELWASRHPGLGWGIRRLTTMLRSRRDQPRGGWR